MSGKDLSEAIRGRRSVRRFRDEPVSRDLILELLELAAWAPSAGNRQDWQFLVVFSPEVKEQLAWASRERWAAVVETNRARGFAEELEGYSATFSWFDKAPVLVVISTRAVDSVQRHMLGTDAEAVVGGAASAAMATQTLMLAAHERGLGSCCLTGALAARREIRRLLGLKRNREVVCLLALGWPEAVPAAPQRKPVGELVRFM